MPQPPSPRYTALLALVAMTVLGVGYAIRPEQRAEVVVGSPSPAEVRRLQRLALRSSIESLPEYVALTARDVARFVVRVGADGHTGIVWSTDFAVSTPIGWRASGASTVVTASGDLLPASATISGPHLPLAGFQAPISQGLRPAPRRTELIEAVIAAIHAQGFASLTVNDIARNAQTSTGSIHYYFGSKEALLEATMRHLLSILRAATVRRLAGQSTPADRLRAILAANFDERLFTRQNCSVWSQFWAHAPYVPGLARLQRMNRSRVRSNLRRELKLILPVTQADEVCVSIQSYMDGIWINVSQTQAEPVPDMAQRDAMSFLAMLVREQQ